MIVIVGDVMLDRYFWGMVTRISPEAPVPITQVIQTTYSLGGAANTAANVIGIGKEAVIIGATGKDQAAEVITQLMRDYGITDYLVAEKDRPTTMKTRVIAGSQQLLRIDDETIKPLYKRNVRTILNNIDKILPKCKVAIVSDYGKGVVSADIPEYLLEKGITTFVDPKGVNWELYRGVYCITPNMKEFLDYYNVVYRVPINSEIDFRKAAMSVVKDLDLQHLVITRGADGMLVVPREGNIYHAEVKQVEEVLDVSGAGDTVIAALACKIADGEDINDAADFANIAGGIVVSRLGTSPIAKGEI
jgi:D-beta-D-heptose 7-phosphate kinase/D-beta-D-heptose 1-phosphate adenosyltransferase